MLVRVRFLLVGALCASAVPAAAQSHSTPVARRPHSFEIARVNADLGSISVFDASANAPVDLDPGGPGVSRGVGAEPRTLAYSVGGDKLYVANMRGEGGDYPNLVFGSVSVLDAANGYQVLKTITAGIGVEPYGIAMARDGGFAAVTNHRSGSVSFIDTATDTVSFTFAYDWDPDAPGNTQAEVDPDLDGQPNHGLPRGIAITTAGDAVYVTHFLSGHVTKLALERASPGGKVVGATLAADISLDRYAPPVDGQGKPIFVTADASQGAPRFLESITIEPGGARAWVPHVLSNFRVLVEETRFSVDNQVYPAVSILDLTTDTFEYGLPGKSDASDRIMFDPSLPIGELRSVGKGTPGTGGIAPSLDVQADPHPGGGMGIRVNAARGGSPALLFVGAGTTPLPTASGTLHVAPLLAVLPLHLGGAPGTAGAGGLLVTGTIPDALQLVGQSVSFQVAVVDPAGQGGAALTNAGVVEIRGQPTLPPATFGRRVALPVQVEFTTNGRNAMVVNLSSEDVAVFDVTGPAPKYVTVFPSRSFPRVPFLATQPVGENPTGLALVPRPQGGDYVFLSNATSNDMSQLLIGPNGIMGQFAPRVPVVTDDTLTPQERAGRELFFDATRLQTASNMDGSCAGCHFDGQHDGLTWHFAEGPRQTIPLAGGPLDFGLLFWKAKAASMKTFEGGFRIHMGGHGQMSPADVEALTAWAHEHVPLPLNPRAQQPLTDSELRGKDLFFGTNDFGANPSLRSANCLECHPNGLFTVDQLSFPSDPCKSMEPLFANLQNVNTADEDGELLDDHDFEFTEDCDGDGVANTFFRAKPDFGVPTKLGVFASPPYFHHGRALNLRAVIDPASQTVGPSLEFAKNTAHDLRGFVVSFTLQTSPTEQDIQDLLAFIARL